MLIALISDLHSNIHALKAVMADIKRQGVQRVICLGDVIGYGPHPGQCIDMVQEQCAAVLMGNHEEALLNAEEAANFNPRARRAIDWTREFLQRDGDEATINRRWEFFSSLKTQAVAGEYLFVHASPRDPTREYVLPRDARNREKMEDIFNHFKRICFVGHTHVPGIFLENGTFTAPSDLWAASYFINPNEKALVNIGSVGQPRDGLVDASYVIIDNEDPDSPAVRFMRVPYDNSQTITDILNNPNLDDSLGERLKHGR